jgi:hypothetical protein
VKELVNEQQLFKNVYANSGDAIDKACCSVPWLLYGSSKSEDMDSYQYKGTRDHNCEKLTLSHAFNNYKLYDTSEQPIIVKGNIKKLLPQILSINPACRSTQEIKHGLVFDTQMKANIEKENKKAKKEKNKNLSLNATEAIEIATKLMPMLADYRASDRNEWMKIGWILYSIGEGSQEAFDLWI